MVGQNIPLINSYTDERSDDTYASLGGHHHG